MNMQQMKSTKKIAVLAALSILASASLFAQRTMPVNLERMVKQAGVIVHATVAKTESARDPRTHLLYTQVTLDVKENFFGAADAMYSFRQYGGSEQGHHFYPEGMVHYKAGDDIIILLYAKSSSGLQSPVGMKQGIFSVSADTKTNARVVANQLNNRGLFASMQSSSLLAKKNAAADPGPVQYEEFAQTLRTLVQQLKK
jgi:hypothetical protein